MTRFTIIQLHLCVLQEGGELPDKGTEAVEEAAVAAMLESASAQHIDIQLNDSISSRNRNNNTDSSQPASESH